MINISYSNIIIEFEYPVSYLYQDFKGRLINSLIDTFPKVYLEDDRNTSVRMISEDESIYAKLSPYSSGLLLDCGELSGDFDKGFARYIDLFYKVYETASNMLEIKSKIQSVSIKAECNMNFQDNKLFKSFKSGVAVPNAINQIFDGQVEGFLCTYIKNIDGARNVFTLNEEKENVVLASLEVNYPAELIKHQSIEALVKGVLNKLTNSIDNLC